MKFCISFTDIMYNYVIIKNCNNHNVLVAGTTKTKGGKAKIILLLLLIIKILIVAQSQSPVALKKKHTHTCIYLNGTRSQLCCGCTMLFNCYERRRKTRICFICGLQVQKLLYFFSSVALNFLVRFFCFFVCIYELVRFFFICFLNFVVSIRFVFFR